MRNAPGPRSAPSSEGKQTDKQTDVAGTCNPCIQEMREEGQKFKAILPYIQFEASLGNVRTCLF